MELYGIGLFIGDTSSLIGIVDENGNIEFVDSKLSSLGIQMNLDELKEINIENLMVKSEELTKEELEKYLEKLKKGEIEEDSEEKDKEMSKEDAKKAEKELNEKTGNNYEFYYYKKITKPGLAEEINGSRGKKLAFALDKNRGAIIIDEETGERLKGTENRKIYKKNSNYNKRKRKKIRKAKLKCNY